MRASVRRRRETKMRGRSTLMFSTVVIIFIMMMIITSPVGESYLLASGSEYIRFDAGLGSRNYRNYDVDKHRTPHYVTNLVNVDSKTGVVHILWNTQWNTTNSKLSDMFVTVYVASSSKETSIGTVDFVSMPFLIVPPQSTVIDSDFRAALRRSLRPLRTIVSVVTKGELNSRLCFRQSQLILHLPDVIPASFRGCRLRFGSPVPPHFAVESSGADLVTRTDYCFEEDYGRVTLTLFLRDCGPYWHRDEMEHSLDVILHKIGVDRFDNRILRNRAIGRARREVASGDDDDMAADRVQFERQLYMVTVPEEREKGERVVTVTAIDPRGRPLTYSMLAVLDSRSQNMFRMDSSTGEVTTAAKLDREFVDVHYFRVMASDTTESGRTASATLQIDVSDVNDHAPTFEQSLYETVVREGATVGSVVATVRATDLDADDNARISYELVTGDGDDTFRLDAETGVLTTRRQLDREVVAGYELTVLATDGDAPDGRRSATATVRVTISDDNDNYPQFEQRSYTVQVPENVNWSVNPVVARISATDLDAGSNGAVRYTLVSGNTQGKFVLDGVTGQLSVAGPLDYEETRSYRLSARAQDGGIPPRSNTTQVQINVLDVNDNAPRFYSPSYHETVMENVPVGTQVVRLQAYDADDGDNAKVSYTPVDAPANFPFAIDPQTGWVTSVREVDREEAAVYSFVVEARDGGQPSLAANASVTIVIQDVNDNSPKFDTEFYEGVVAEDAPLGTAVVAVIAHDPDESSRLVYQIVEGNQRGRFSVSPQGGKGVISVAQPLDYRQENRFVLTVSATDSGGRSAVVAVYVNVTDANTHRPVFEQAPYSTSILEDVPVGTTVLVVSASDGDVGDNARISYSLATDDEGDFKIDAETGAILTSRPLDRERQAGYIISVTAADHGQPPLSDTTDVEITVADVNDNQPVFEQSSYKATVREDAPMGTSVLTVKASDEDQGLNGRVRYTLGSSPAGTESGIFSLDPTSGVIRTARLLDREVVARHQLTAIAVDRGSPELSATTTVIVDVEDVNDNPPRFSADRLELWVPENSPVGTLVGVVSATDPDDGVNAQVTYSIAGGVDAEAFSLSSTREGAAELVLRVELDYESPKKKFDLLLRAASPPLRSDVPVEVLVQDVNDNAPVLRDFRIVFNNYPRHFPRGAIGRIPAYDADVTDNLTYSFISGNNAALLRLNSTTGDIYLNPSLDTNVPLHAILEVSVTDGINEVNAECQLSVLMVTDAMLFHSVSVRVAGVTREEFLSPLMALFVEGMAAIVPSPKENVHLFDIQEEQDDQDQELKAGSEPVLKLSFAVLKADGADDEGRKDQFYPTQFLKERIYPERALLARITTLKVLPFADDLCVREPCLDFDRCLSVQTFGNASARFLASETVLFRAIHPVSTFACRCPTGFAGAKEHYLCDVEVDLCYSNPCRNNGTCLRHEGGYACACREDFTGHDCETDVKRGSCVPGLCHGGSRCANYIKGGLLCENCTQKGGSSHWTSFCELRTRSFIRGSFLTLPSLQQRHRFVVSLEFATVEPNGLLLYNGRYNDKHDFVALELAGGRVQFSYSLGFNVSRVTAEAVQRSHQSSIQKARLDDGQWHKVYLEYVNRTATLWVDDCDREMSLQFGKRLGGYYCANKTTQNLDERCSDPTVTCHRFLDLTGPLQIGGVPSLPTSFQVSHTDFVGCIRDLKIDDRFVDFNSFVVDNGTSEGCPAKRAFCLPSPCRNGGTCEEHWKTYTCHCPVGFGGKDCEKGIDPPRHFKGDGVLIYDTSLRPIQAQWMNSLSLRTTAANGLLLAVNLGTKESSVSDGTVAIMDLVNGSLRYSYGGTSLYLNATRIDDGNWHRAEVKWMTTGIWMAIDYGRFEVIGRMNTSVQGLYAIKVFVGGIEPSKSFIPNFKGCIQDVRVGSDQDFSLRPTTATNVLGECPSPDHCRTLPCSNASRCVSLWDRRECHCLHGHYGPSCQHACGYKPCLNGGTCVPDNDAPGGYRCMCPAQRRGSHCQHRTDGPCPSGWWGRPSCGPCRCPTQRGYDANCDQTDGTCRCRLDHYRLPGSDTCLPCDCYRIGSFGTACDLVSGQCRCRSSVIGRKCEACPHALAEVTLRGCEVVYDGCPKSLAGSIWWERTYFGDTAIQTCPAGSKGKASRKCTMVDGWGEPELFNCTTIGLVSIFATLSELEKGKTIMDSDLAVQLSKDLYALVNASSPLPGELYGTDVWLTAVLLRRILKHESSQSGLNLSHRQDRDFLQNVLEALSHLLDPSYLPLWKQIGDMGLPGPEVLVAALDDYARNLIRNQGDTFTPPFEIVTPNIVFGMDTVSPIDAKTYVDFTSLPGGQRAIGLPKYNNYPARPTRFDRRTRVYLPVTSLLPTTNSHRRVAVTSSYKTVQLPTTRKRGSYNTSAPRAFILDSTEASGGVAAISYIVYISGGALLPTRFSREVRQRWGTPLVVQSPVFGLNVHSSNQSYGILRSTTSPFRIRFVIQAPSSHKDPQCVYWKPVLSNDGKAPIKDSGHWSSTGCSVQWSKVPHTNRTVVNCTCWHLSTFAVIMDLVDEDRIPEASLAEEVITTIGLGIAILTLTMALTVFCLLRGLQTNSNTIHKNLALCTLLICIVFLIALRMRKTLVHKEFPCKLIAIFLHHLYLCQFSWMMVEGLHLYRMLTEMRDINHGQMRFYYSMGYGAPAIVVGLAVGVRADEYGNPIFCWLSVYGSAVWSLVGPVCFVVMLNLGIFVLAIHASVRMKEHVEDFGNLKTLLWLGIVLLPLMGATWVLAILAVNENQPVLYYLYSIFVAAQGVYVFLGYCIINEKVRSQLNQSWCRGKKGGRTNTGMNTSGTTVVSQRSALAYHNNSFDVLHRNVGISTSSTTSRSTTKTSGSPFRPHTATSTSTPPSQCPSDFLHSRSLHEAQHKLALRTGRSRTGLYGYGKPLQSQDMEDLDASEDYRAKKSGDSDTESDLSLDHASLDLASSHSSDEEDPKNRVGNLSWRQNGNLPQRDLPANSNHLVYAPNILSNEPIVRNYNIPAPLNIYSTQWSTRGPASLPPFVPRPGQDDISPKSQEVDRASMNTASDNELNLHTEPGLTEAVFSRFSPPLIDADEMSSPDQLPAPDGGFASRDGSTPTSPRPAALLLAERRMVVPPMTVASGNSDSEGNLNAASATK